MIPLDIFQKNMENKPIQTRLEAWLMFLSTDEPDRIIQLISSYPEFKPMDETLYQLCRNVEEGDARIKGQAAEIEVLKRELELVQEVSYDG